MVRIKPVIKRTDWACGRLLLYQAALPFLSNGNKDFLIITDIKIVQREYHFSGNQNFINTIISANGKILDKIRSH